MLTQEQYIPYSTKEAVLGLCETLPVAYCFTSRDRQELDCSLVSQRAHIWAGPCQSSSVTFCSQAGLYVAMLLEPKFEYGWNISQMRRRECRSQNYELPSRHKNNCAQVYTCGVFARSRFCLAHLYKCQVYGQAVLVSAGYSPIPFKVPSAISYICQVYGLSLLFSILCHVINNGNECLLNDSCTGCSCKIHGHTFPSFPYLSYACQNSGHTFHLSNIYFS